MHLVSLQRLCSHRTANALQQSGCIDIEYTALLDAPLQMRRHCRDLKCHEHTIFGVRLKVMPWMSVGMELKKPSGRAMVRGSVLTRPWSSNCSKCKPRVSVATTAQPWKLATTQRT